MSQQNESTYRTGFIAKMVLLNKDAVDKCEGGLERVQWLIAEGIEKKFDMQEGVDFTLEVERYHANG